MSMRTASRGGSRRTTTPGASVREALSEEQRLYEAASMYYVQAETMEVIARHLGCSRSTVSRLLARARHEGVVRIELVQPGGAGSLEARLAAEFGVRAQIVPVREGTTDVHRLQQVAAVAAARMVEMISALAGRADGSGAVTASGREPEAEASRKAGGDGPRERTGASLVEPLVVGVAWGTTMSEVVDSLPVRRVPRLTVVQLNGASDPFREGPSAGQMLAGMGEALGARTIAFPVPAFFDRVATREAMWSERSVKRVLGVARRARLAAFGVGAVDGPLPSRVYQGGHLTRADLAVARREGVVGDVCTVLLREDGTWGDMELNARATGPTPIQLARIPRRLCVVAGTWKARACLAALRARVATDLVIDDATASAVLALAHRKESP